MWRAGLGYPNLRVDQHALRSGLDLGRDARDAWWNTQVLCAPTAHRFHDGNEFLVGIAQGVVHARGTDSVTRRRRMPSCSSWRSWSVTGITADFPLPWRLTLTGGYLFADLQQRSVLGHLPLVALTETGTIGRFTFADRNRFEKLVGFGASPVRYRNLFLVDRPLGAHDRWHLFADDAFFFDVSAGAWSQNRAQAGGGARLNRRLLLDVYYLQAERQRTGTDYPGAGDDVAGEAHT
jgi:hypothetical protein